MAHAKFSASGSKRWMNCPGSIALSEAAPKKGSSVYAMLGTAAHALGEECLAKGHATPKWAKGQYIDIGQEDKVRFLTASKPLENPPPTMILVDEDMIEAVQVYLDTVRQVYEELGGKAEAEMALEQRLDLSWLRPNMFGTADCKIAKWMDTLVIIDYKHGKGVSVEIEGNTQLRYYALGAAAEYDFEFEKVRMIIVQPRCHHSDGPVREEVITMAELRAFEKQLAEGYDRANEESAILNPGEWCKFCPALGIPPGEPGHCEASWAKVQEMAKTDFELAPALDDGIPIPTTPEQLSLALQWVPFIDAWCKRVSSAAEAAAQSGVEIPGFKLVQKRTIRKWNDFVQDEDLEQELTKTLGLKTEDLYAEPKRLTPPQLEKKLDKAGKALLANSGLVVKPDGALTLVANTDPRQAQVPQLQAQTDFEGAPEVADDD